MDHLGASRSVSPEMERKARRFFDANRLGDESWYLSGKRDAGSVRYVCKAQDGSGCLGGDLKLNLSVGWSPVGLTKAARYANDLDVGCE